MGGNQSTPNNKSNKNVQSQNTSRNQDSDSLPIHLDQLEPLESLSMSDVHIDNPMDKYKEIFNPAKTLPTETETINLHDLIQDTEATSESPFMSSTAYKKIVKQAGGMMSETGSGAVTSDSQINNSQSGGSDLYNELIKNKTESSVNENSLISDYTDSNMGTNISSSSDNVRQSFNKTEHSSISKNEQSEKSSIRYLQSSPYPTDNNINESPVNSTANSFLDTPVQQKPFNDDSSIINTPVDTKSNGSLSFSNKINSASQTYGDRRYGKRFIEVSEVKNESYNTSDIDLVSFNN